VNAFPPEPVPAMTWIYNIILLLSTEGTRSRQEPVPADTIIGYIYTTTREPVPAVAPEHVPGARCEPVPAVCRESVPAGTRSRRNPFPPEHVPGGVPERVPDGTRSRRAPVPAASPERVPGEPVPAVLDGGGCKAGGAGGTVVRTYGYLSFSRRCTARGSLGGNI